MKLSGAKLTCLLGCLSLLILFVATAGAQNMQQIKAQMLERKPTLDAMKASGVIGEGNDGYLHIRQQGANSKVVNEENADRTAVNSMIAKKEGSTVEQVSRAVAAKLRASAPRGHWIQEDDGGWRKK